MSFPFRLAGKITGPQILRLGPSGIINFVRPVSLQSSPYSLPKTETYDERNVRLGRPQSPHLTIYKPQLTSMLSISHRATGMALTAYAVAFGAAAVCLDSPIEYWIEQLKLAQLGPACIFGLKFTLAFPLTYHFWNGIRHLLWDSGKFLTIKEVYLTGYAMLAIATATSLVLSGLS